jgi:hypothetical protein
MTAGEQKVNGAQKQGGLVQVQDVSSTVSHVPVPMQQNDGQDGAYKLLQTNSRIISSEISRRQQASHMGRVLGKYRTRHSTLH